MDEKVDAQKKKKRPFGLLGIIVIAFLLLLLTAVLIIKYRSDPREASRLETVSAGNQIIHALEIYHLENGRYPASLDLLVPKYLSELKPPAWGEDGWRYTFESPDSYSIEVGYRDGKGGYYPSMIYSSVNSGSGWMLDV